MDELPEDLLSIIFNYLELEDMIIMRRLGNKFNNILVSNIRTKLKILSGFNTNLLDINLLINLCKIYIIKSNVFAGQDRSFITTDGRTYCTTLNQVLEFGDDIVIPKVIGDIFDIKCVAINTNDTVFLFDNNDVKHYYKHILKQEDFIRSSENIKQMSICKQNLLLLDNNNEVYMIGPNKNKDLNLVRHDDLYDTNIDQLYLRNFFNSPGLEVINNSELLPMKYHNSYLINNLPKIKQITICDSYGLCLAEDNQIYGFSTQTSNINYMSFLNEDVKLIEHNIDEPINFILTKYGFNVFITNNFNIYTCYGDNFKCNKIPLSNIVQCSIGLRHVLLLSLTGQVYTEGLNLDGQLGLGYNNEKNDEWIVIPNLNNIIKIAAGDHHSLFLTADEKVYACGRNDKGQLGLGHTNNVNVPTLVIDLRL